MDENTKIRLVEICSKYKLPEEINVVVKEAYIPYIPSSWNGILVLAESQNLSAGNGEYVQSLESLTEEERITRLGNDDGGIGVYPWDDGSLKLAIESALEVNADETGVSNAVVWSQRGNTNQNINPESSLQKVSSSLWKKLLPVLNPSVIVCCGNVASDVIDGADWDGEVKKLRLPSKMAMSRVSGMFNEKDLLSRYPEVDRVVKRHPKWTEGGYSRNKIFFACHAVSTIGT